MVVNDRPFKRLRRVTADLYDLFTFPAVVADDVVSGSPFRSNVQSFLSKHARPTFPPSLFPCLATWQILLRIGDLAADDDCGGPAFVVLDIVEEDVTRSRSRSVYCDQCRVVGWSGHPVCRKRYHFIIRRESSSSSSPLLQLEQGYQKACLTCGNLQSLSDSRCKTCGCEISAEEIEEWVNVQFEDTSHILHGVVHSNGYGHLRTLNGREGGSTLLSGFHIMNFWDRLCSTLAVRKVSVMDVSKKYGMEYRLLHAITNGHTWYGGWGYEFGAGSYALTLEDYQDAVKNLSSVPLSLFSYRGRKPRTRLQEIIAFYKSISDSQLESFRDIFSLILRLIHEIRRSSEAGKCESYVSSTTNVLCAWTRSDVECVEQAIIKVLLIAANGDNWVSMRALKGALCKTASPQLLDYCLKHMGGKMAPNGMVVNVQCNPSSSSVEFRLEPLSHGAGSNSNHPSKEHLVLDLRFLYDSLLHPQTMVSYSHQATRELVIDSATTLLDCKQFVKDYMPDKMAPTNPSAIHVWCHVELAEEPKDDPSPAPAPVPPPELVVLPENACVADLKVEVSKAFQEVYAMFKRFEADKILDYGRLDDSITLKFLVGSTGSVRIQGRCLGTQGLNRFQMERGTEDWTVDCICGAQDDDGERMLACDTCGVWMHTRCAGIDDVGEIPSQFVCMECVSPYEKTPNKVAKFDEDSDKDADKVSQSGEESNKCLLSSGTCRDEATTTNSHGIESNYNMSCNVR